MSDLSQAAAAFFDAAAAFTADTRLYEIDTASGTDRLLVERWVGREALSDLYEWQVFCLAADVHVDLDSLVGRQATLRTRLADGSQHARSGWVVEAAQLGADGGFARYRLTLVPWLWLATQRRNSRVFQDQSVLDIVEEIFAADGACANWRTAPEVDGFLARVRPRSYCCQYRETDFAFLQRLLAEEGLGFFFEEAGDDSNSISRQRLVLFADSTAFPDDSCATAHGGIRFHRNAATETADTIQSFGAKRQLQPSITSLASWDYKAKRVNATTLSTAQTVGGDHAPSIESYDWAGLYAFAGADDAEHYARLLREAVDARCKTRFGTGCVRSFRAGCTFTLQGSPLDQFADLGLGEAQRRFTLLEVTHAGVNNLAAGFARQILGALGPILVDDCAGDADDTFSLLQKTAEASGYANRFTALRADVRWRPVLVDGTGAVCNPRPLVHGSQTAIVVGADGGTAQPGTVHTDHLGRVRIRFHWQTAESRGCWVRVLQRYAGAGYGAQFIPRIGAEVLVKFFDGDIDRPFVAAVLHNGLGQDDDRAFAQGGDHAPAGQDNRIGHGASPAWHGAAGAHKHAGHLCGFKSVALGANGYSRQASQLVFDDSTGRLRTQLATDSFATQLNLGHLIHQADNYRGSWRGTGWELRTDACGALRAGKGILLTTSHGRTPDGEPEPAGDNTAGIALFKQAKGFADAFNKAASLHQTVQFILVKGHTHNGERNHSCLDADQPPMAAMLRALSGMVDAQDGGVDANGQKIPHMQGPLVVITAQPGIGVAASDGLHIATGEGAHFAAGRDLELAVGEAFSVHSGQAIGLLAGAMGTSDDGSGITLFAGQGNVELQAQSGEMTLAAKETVQLLSANSHIDLAAAKRIVLSTEGGASLTIEGGNITFACPGTLSMKSASKAFAGPERMPFTLPKFPRSICKRCRRSAAASGSPFALVEE